MTVSRPLFDSKFLSIVKIELCLFLVTIWLNFYITDQMCLKIQLEFFSKLC